jgi:hypothetical protein
MVFSYSVVCLNDLVSDFSSPSDLIWSLQSSLKIFSRHIFRMNFCLFAHFRLRRFLLLPSSDLKPHVCWLFIAFLLRQSLISTVQSASFGTPSAFAAPDFSENAVGSELLKICCLKLPLLCQLRVFFVRSLILPDWKKCFPDILPIAVSALNFWSAVIFRNWLFGSDRFPAWFSVLFQDLASPDTESGKIRNPYVYFGLYPLCLDSACLAVGILLQRNPTSKHSAVHASTSCMSLSHTRVFTGICRVNPDITAFRQIFHIVQMIRLRMQLFYSQILPLLNQLRGNFYFCQAHDSAVRT